MSIRKTPWPAGIPCWADLATSDFESARAVYAEAFGWLIPDGNPATGGYSNATRDGHNAAGFMAARPGQSSAWFVYLASDDITATAAAIVANGGSVVMGPHEVPGTVHMLLATDPQGGVFGVTQAISHIGAEITSEPGGLAWEHCVQPDPEAGKAFYGAVFGWHFEPLPSGTDGGYLFSGAADEPPYGSFGAMGPEFPAGWQVTFGTADVDAVVATFEAAGGSALMPAADSPWGRMAMIADPTGATFTVMETAGNPTPERD